MIVAALIILGVCLGSFVNAMAWRMHAGKDWVRGRSECDQCGHQLAAADLLPLFSWLALGGRCRYCKKPISWQHPAVELAMAGVFAGSYYFWPVNLLGAGQWLLFTTWLITAVGLTALLLYDLHYMLLPSRILYPTLLVAAAGRTAYILGYESNRSHALLNWGLSLLVASGIFLALFYVSSGRWIGFGDVRLGLITGTVLAAPAKSFLMIFLASLLGTLFVLPEVAAGRTTMNKRIPYGPFLIAATVISLLFGASITAWYHSHFL